MSVYDFDDPIDRLRWLLDELPGNKERAMAFLQKWYGDDREKLEARYREYQKHMRAGEALRK